jgi:hypothetical protein
MVPTDLVTDLDLLALDGQAASDFGGADLSVKRALAVQAWLTPRLEKAGYVPRLHLTRDEPAGAWGVTGGVWTDLRGPFSSRTDDVTALADVFVTPATDALYLGGPRPFKGVFWHVLDAGNSSPAVSSVAYWNGQWTAFGSLVDATVAASMALAVGGRMTWTTPDDWIARPLTGDTAHRFWIRVQLSAAPSSPSGVSQVLLLRRSRLTTPTARYALGTLYQEGVGGSRGRWQEKAEAFFKAADAELELVLPLCRDEFDIDESGSLGSTEASSVVPANYLYEWQRG